MNNIGGHGHGHGHGPSRMVRLFQHFYFLVLRSCHHQRALDLENLGVDAPKGRSGSVRKLDWDRRLTTVEASLKTSRWSKNPSAACTCLTHILTPLLLKLLSTPIPVTPSQVPTSFLAVANALILSSRLDKNASVSEKSGEESVVMKSSVLA